MLAAQQICEGFGGWGKAGHMVKESSTEEFIVRDKINFIQVCKWDFSCMAGRNLTKYILMLSSAWVTVKENFQAKESLPSYLEEEEEGYDNDS